MNGPYGANVNSTPDADPPGADAHVDATATLISELLRESNRHRVQLRRHPVSQRPIGVACSAAGCRWEGRSVQAFYSQHLMPMVPKIGKPGRDPSSPKR